MGVLTWLYLYCIISFTSSTRLSTCHMLLQILKIVVKRWKITPCLDVCLISSNLFLFALWTHMDLILGEGSIFRSFSHTHIYLLHILLNYTVWTLVSFQCAPEVYLNIQHPEKSFVMRLSVCSRKLFSRVVSDENEPAIPAFVLALCGNFSISLKQNRNTVPV